MKNGWCQLSQKAKPQQQVQSSSRQRLNAINMIRCVIVIYFIKYNLKGLTHSGCENGFTTTPEISLRTGALEVCSRLSPSQEYFRTGKPTRH